MEAPARVAPQAPRVFVITTRGLPAAPASPATHQPHLFGVHFRDKRTQEYRSHVFGFTDGQHARLVAKGLETYYRRHGTFPPRDTRPRFLELRGVDPGVQLENVAVQEVAMPDLLHRLQGSGIAVSLLTRDDETGGKHRFQARTLTTDATPVSVVAALNRNWNASGGTGGVWRSRARYMSYDDLVGRVKTLGLSPARTLHAIPTLPSPLIGGDGANTIVPRLLPKPRWPPAAAAAADEKAKVPLVVQMLAASFLKCLALAEVLTLFYLFPKLLM